MTGFFLYGVNLNAQKFNVKAGINRSAYILGFYYTFNRNLYYSPKEVQNLKMNTSVLSQSGVPEISNGWI